MKYSLFSHCLCGLALCATGLTTAVMASESPLSVRLAKATQLAIEDNRDDARNMLEAIADEYPDSPEAYNNLAVLAAYSEEWPQAIELLEKALATDTRLETSYRNLNAIYRYRAAQAYREALQDAQSEPLALPDLTMLTSSGAEEQIEIAPPTPEAPPPNAKVESDTELPAVDHNVILDAVYAWADAWSNQAVEAYLASYVDGYQPEGFTSHAAWKKVRRDRVSAPAFIEVNVGEEQIELYSRSRALVIFKQDYHSTAFKDSVRKMLVLDNTVSGWRISREYVLQ
ncbi:MAG: hypothetical protein AAF420_06305 [Pseudomonadota bacterium]